MHTKRSIHLAAILFVLVQAVVALAEPPAQEKVISLNNAVNLKLVLIPAGKFMMGSPPSELYHDVNEGPQHEVTISKPFYLGIYDVTQEQYEAVMGLGMDKSRFKGPKFPVQPNSDGEMTAFMHKLSEIIGRPVRLPTEAEWEYACRAGTTTTWFFGDDMKAGAEYAWFRSRGVFGATDVGTKKPNPWGLYDLYGMAAQIVSDWGGQYPKPDLTDYPRGPVTDPKGPDAGIDHIARGAANWLGTSRSAYRGVFSHPEYKDHIYAFRIVVEP